MLTPGSPPLFRDGHVKRKVSIPSGERLYPHRLAHHALRGEEREKAKARSADREAVGSFEQALRARPHLPEQRNTVEQAIDLYRAMDMTFWLPQAVAALAKTG
jgi:hypothetical protein